MTLFDVLGVLCLAAAMEYRASVKREGLWKAIIDLDNRKLDIEP